MGRFIWRIFISYRGLNQITRIHRFPYRRCNDDILHIGKASFRISIDLDSGYWQVPVDKDSRSKLAFFGDREKLRWAGMLMGAVNASALFSWMMEKMKQIWQKKADNIPLPLTTTENIIDDVFLVALLYEVMMAYFDIVAETLKHY